MHTKIKLTNGLTVANFSSAHSFVFEDGSVLAGCSKERCMGLILNAKEVETSRMVGDVEITDIHLSFEMNYSVMSSLIETCMDPTVDVVLVPLPVMQTIPKDALECVKLKARVIRVVDRAARTVSINRFCM